MKKKLETVQIWSKKGLSDLSGETYMMLKKLEEVEKTEIPRIGKSVLLDNATLPYEEIFTKNFEADIESEEFWTNAIEEALHPLRSIRPYVGELNRPQR